MLHEIDTQLNAIVALGNQGSPSKPISGESATTTNDADKPEGEIATEGDCVSEDEYALFTTDVLMIDDVYGTLQGSSSVVKPCLADINLM